MGKEELRVKRSPWKLKRWSSHIPLEVLKEIARRYYEGQQNNNNKKEKDEKDNSFGK